MTILNEFSHHRPALAVSSGLAGGEQLHIAWTAEDARLNVMPAFDDGSHKLVLDETSNAGPALAFANGELWIAWTGTDAGLRLNVMPVEDPTRKIILDESSIAGPALTTGPKPNQFADELLWLAWAGTDGNGTLNYMSPFDPGGKNIKQDWHTDSEPGLAYDSTDTLMMAWIAKPDGHIEFSPASPKEGIGHGTLQEWSFTGPSLFNLGQNLQVAWTGTDKDHMVNVMPLLGDPTQKRTLHEALSPKGPALIVFDGALHVAFVGVDGAFHLNVLRL